VEVRFQPVTTQGREVEVRFQPITAQEREVEVRFQPIIAQVIVASKVDGLMLSSISTPLIMLLKKIYYCSTSRCSGC